MAWAKNPIYLDNDGVTLLSAVIIYTDKSCDELLEMQIDGRGDNLKPQVILVFAE